MIKVYEIHRYLNDQFQYVVARTHKYTEEKVHLDVKRMNEMLSADLRESGVRYVFAIEDMSTSNKKTPAKYLHQQNRNPWAR
ncbi:MAG: hypothetical protein WBL44_10045 [Nitrososphaeraceae archaeon]|jgi:hypothetical protein